MSIAGADDHDQDMIAISRASGCPSGFEECGERAGNVGNGDQPGRNRRAGDEEHHHGADLGGRDEDVEELRRRQFAIDDQSKRRANRRRRMTPASVG